MLAIHGGTMVKRIAQQYSKAAASRDLRDDATHHDTDTLAAIALSSDLGSKLYAVKYANDATSYAALLRGWEWHVTKHAALMGWPQRVNEIIVAKASLDFWLIDHCQACQGIGKARILFADLYSDDPCPQCDGSGKRPIPANRHIQAYVAQMVQALEDMAVKAGNDAIKKLAKEIEL